MYRCCVHSACDWEGDVEELGMSVCVCMCMGVCVFCVCVCVCASSSTPLFASPCFAIHIDAGLCPISACASASLAPALISPRQHQSAPCPSTMECRFSISASASPPACVRVLNAQSKAEGSPMPPAPPPRPSAPSPLPSTLPWPATLKQGTQQQDAPRTHTRSLAPYSFPTINALHGAASAALRVAV